MRTRLPSLSTFLANIWTVLLWFTASFIAGSLSLSVSGVFVWWFAFEFVILVHVPENAGLLLFAFLCLLSAWLARRFIVWFHQLLFYRNQSIKPIHPAQSFVATVYLVPFIAAVALTIFSNIVGHAQMSPIGYYVLASIFLIIGGVVLVAVGRFPRFHSTP